MVCVLSWYYKHILGQWRWRAKRPEASGLP